MKKIIITMIVSLLVISLMPVATGCGSLPQVVFETSVTSGPAPLNVVFTNKTGGVTSDSSIVFDWEFGDGEKKTGTAFSDPITHEYTKAGTFTVVLTGYKKDAPLKTIQANQAITVAHGTLNVVKITPKNAELDIGKTQSFTGEAFDAYGNPVPEATISWKEGEAGTVTGDGVLTAGTAAGKFTNGIIGVATISGSTAEGVAAVTVKPDSLDKAEMPVFEVAAGETAQLEPFARDKYGNLIDNVEAVWMMENDRAGTVTDTGVFTASRRAASYQNAIKVTVKEGNITREATGEIVIVPGEMTQAGISPENIDLGKGMSQQFIAVGADKYGNIMTDVECIWSADGLAGTITEDGLFTARNTPGSYKDAVVVTVMDGDDAKVTKKATVNVEQDRVIFISDRGHEEEGIFNYFIMDIDGNNVKEFTFPSEGFVEFRMDCSDDGRRLVYVDVVYNDEGLVVGNYTRIVNTDGTWAVTLNDGNMVREPAISPDGTKIAFQSWDTDPPEIYVMDIDGGNFQRLTDNDIYDDYPDWSPDGTEIVYVSRHPGTLNPKIYIMNADGTGKRQVTESYHYDTFPQWSPDGEEILYSSNQFVSVDQGAATLNTWGIYAIKPDGTGQRTIWASAEYNADLPRWSPDGSKIIFCANSDLEQIDLYMIDRDGNNLTRITDTSAIELAPVWLLPKKGVKVDTSSVVLEENYGEPDMSVQEISGTTRDSVVRIVSEVELGTASGTGFIIGPDGLIVTNNHVISGAENITVYLTNGGEYTGTVLARDMIHDLALVKIDATGLPALEIGSLSGVTVGQQVIVLGYPLGNKNVSVTSGLVSSIEYDDGRNTTWIQTDSAINPGNSGGPILDMHGTVIGVVTAKMAGIAVEGIGYAISADTVLIYLDELLKEAGITL